MTPTSPPTAPADALARVYARVTQVLSLAPESSPAHRVEAYRGGLRVACDRGDVERPAYAVMLPWARGFSVFTTDDPNATNHDYRNNLGFAESVPNPRNTNGAENVNVDKLISTFIDAITYLEDYCEDTIEPGDVDDVVFYDLW